MATDQADSYLPSSAESVELAVQAVRRFARPLWLDLLRRDQSERWRSGAGVPAERYFALLPELREDSEDALVMVCGEVRCRFENGERAVLADYALRFPSLADDLAIQFELDATLGNLSDDADSRSAVMPRAFQLPGFEILRQIGHGASSRVYLARQISVDRLVALKVVALAQTDESELRRHLQEASILSRMKHPNIVQIYDTIESEGTLYLVIEYVDGPTLTESTGGLPQPPVAAANLVRKLAQTVHAVHEAGILHRDLKPSNILLTPRGEPKITDFGLAKLLSNASSLTTRQCLLGTPSYMPPEQAAADSRSGGAEGDVYSLGAILYELLTGRPPFLGLTILDTLGMIRERDPTPPRASQPATPRDLETICLKCLAKVPQARYHSAADLADDLGRFLSGVPIFGRRPSWRERTARWCHRNPLAAVLSTGLIVTVAAGLVGIVWQWRDAEHARSRESAARREADQRAQDASEGIVRLKLASTYLERGHSALDERRWDDAHRAFTRAVELRPDHVQGFESRGEFLYMRLGLPDFAARDMVRAFELREPSLPPRWLWNALLRIHQGDVAGYQQVCHRLRERKDRNGAQKYAYFLVRSLGLSPVNEPLDQEIVKLADELAYANPTVSAMMHVRALAYLRSGRDKEAIEFAQQSLALEMNGFCRELNYPILVLAYQRLGQTDEARAAFVQADDAMNRWMNQRCATGPDSWVVSMGASAIWPINPWDWLEYEVYLREARGALGLDARAEDPRARLLRARALAGMRRFDAATEEYNAALELAPDDKTVRMEAHRIHAYSLVRRADYGEAAREFTLASALSTEDCRLMEFRALCHLAAGEEDAYRATCAEMLQRFGNTQDGVVASAIVDVCLLRSDALPDMNQLARLGQIATVKYYGGKRVLGAVHYRTGQCREAVDCFQEVAKIAPLRAWDLAFFAMALFRLGNQAEAREHLKEATRWMEVADKSDPDDLMSPGPAWGGWYEKVQVPILIAEAQAMIYPTQ